MLAHKLPEENLVRLMQEAAGLGKPSVKSDGTLTFDYMLEASKIVEKSINSCPGISKSKKNSSPTAGQSSSTTTSLRQ